MLDERQEQHHMQLLLTNGKSLSVFVPADEVKIHSLPLVDFSEHLRKTYRVTHARNNINAHVPVSGCKEYPGETLRWVQGL